jgi:sugar phosphate isomerase/epimerase
MPAERFRSVSDIRKVCDELNAGAQLAANHGVTLYYHNHWWELHPVDGKPALWHMVDALDPAVQFEIDTYWARTGGVDPAELLRQLGKRASLLHIKDGPCTENDPMVAVGAGAMDFPAVLQAAGTNALWAIVELDRCATDMLEAVAASHAYLSRLVKAVAL